MSLIPFRKEGQIALGDLQQEINGVFERLWHRGLASGPFDGQDWAPAVDVLDQAQQCVIRVEVPGMQATDIDVTCSEGTLVIKGEKACDYDEEDRKGVIRRERRFGGFARSIPLPAGVDAAKIAATCRNGLLEIILPKKEEAKPKVIKIEVNE